MMKKLIISLFTLGALAIGVQAQSSTNNVGTLQGAYDAVKNSGILTATNYAFEPYMTYAPKLSKSTAKVGGGFLAIYNVNTYIGMGLGVDYLGQFNLVSGNATLRYPINIGKTVNFLPSVFTNVVVTPFVLAGVGTPFNNNSTGSSGVAAIADTGAYVQFGNLWGGKFNTGACYGQWVNAGSYSGVRYHLFLGWSKGF